MDVNQRKGSYFLVALHGDKRRIPLFPQGPLLVGRGAHNHLVLNDYRISRQHARVAPERDGFVVYDLNSANGTYVNGAPVRRRQLEPSDEVSFGPLAFRLEFQPDVAVARPNANAPGKWRASESLTRFNRIVVEKPEPRHDDVRKTISPDSDMAVAFGAPGALMTAGPAVAEDIRATSVFDTVEPSEYQATAAAVDLNQLEDAYEKLGTLYGFMQAISKTIDRTELFELVTAKVREIYPQARSVSIFLKNGPEEPEPFARVQLRSDGDTVSTLMPDDVAATMLVQPQSIFGSEAAGPMIGGLTMYAPMIDREETLGVICVAADPVHGGFNAADLQLLTGITSSTAIIFQNARMHEQSLLRERLNRDLELAAQIQKSFLPASIHAPGFEFLATYNAAYTVGGDFYDVFWLGPDRLAVFVGDISGKGVAAALLMARISGELRVAALAHVDPISVFSIMNKAVIGRDQPELFFTAVYFVLDVRTGDVTLATAGHPPPYLRRADGTVRAITEGSSRAIGMLEDGDFEATRLVLEPGDALVLYTDGIVEAADAHKRLYGEARLEASLARAGARPQDISNEILGSVAQFTRNAAVSDDLTLVVCQRSG